MLKRTNTLAYRVFRKKTPPKGVPHPMLVPGRKHANKPARFASPKGAFCYTEHNRMCCAGENGTFMYRVPEMFTLEQNRELLFMHWVTVIDLLRMITQSAGADWWHYRGLYTIHYGWLKKVVNSTCWTDTKRVALVGRTYRFDYKDGRKEINRFTMRLGWSHDKEFCIPFQYPTSLERDQNGNLIISVTCLPLEIEQRNRWISRLMRKKKLEMYTGKGFVNLDMQRPIKLKGKGQLM